MAVYRFFSIGFARLFYRIPREEQMMIDQFGDDYRSYM
jgi:protein-S-isoprenylcysteine O-methyltransferase Ste14